MLDTLSDAQANYLSGILHNILKSNIVLAPEHRRKLLKHASLIRRLASKSTLITVKRELYRKHYKLLLYVFKPLLAQLKAKFCNDK